MFNPDSLEERFNRNHAMFNFVLAAARIAIWEYELQNDEIRCVNQLENFLSCEDVSDGYPFTTFLNRVAFQDRERVLYAIQQTYEQKAEFHIQYQIKLADDQYRWHESKGWATYDQQGRPLRLNGVTQDITERKQTETALLRSERQLLQSQKMEAIGRLAGGIAHDFNNILTVILSYSDLALSSLDDNELVQEGLAEIQKAANQAATLTRQLLTFSRQQVIQPRILDLNKILADMDKLLRRLIGENIELITLPDPRLGLVKADAGHLEQVIVNLVVNAKDALPNGGKLILETSNVELDEEYARQQPEVVAGPYVRLAVSDNGMGMDEATRSQLFEPFFTTKETGQGTGLGLATVYTIVKQSGGHIEVYSELGQGAIFKIYLPRVNQRLASSSPALVTTNRLPGGTETILLVEDEERVRALTAKMLRSYGYKVLEAKHGRDALLLCENHSEKIDLVLTDVLMPYVSGRELVESLSKLQPNLRVIYTSGYTQQSLVQRNILEEGATFLQKPFTPSQLARKVRGVLDNT